MKICNRVQGIYYIFFLEPCSVNCHNLKYFKFFVQKHIKIFCEPIT